MIEHKYFNHDIYCIVLALSLSKQGVTRHIAYLVLKFLVKSKKELFWLYFALPYAGGTSYDLSVKMSGEAIRLTCLCEGNM